MALIAHEANVEVAGDDTRPVTSLYGDGTDGRHDHLLGERELPTAVLMSEPLEGERAAYFRAISRALAEWPLVEAIVRLVVTEGKIRFARVAVGGVAPIPLRLARVEEALLDRPPSAETVDQGASLAADGAKPLPMTRYKVELIPGTLRETIQRALA
jgi:xanthine dehydrogenase YagS FAD-binding subunit